MEEIKEIKQQLDIIINKVVIIMNYTEKETVSLNANTLPNIPLKTKLKMKNLVHLFLAILYYLTIFSFVIVILSIGYQFLKWIWE